MKLPPNVYMGEGIGIARNSKGHIFVNTCAQQTKTFEFDEKGNYVRDREGALRACVLSRRARRCPGQHLGDRRGRQLHHQVQPGRPRDHGAGPAGRVAHGRHGRPSDGAGSGSALHLQSPHRRRIRRGRQHLRGRRLRQFTHRQVRQERPLHQTSRQSRIGPASSPCCMPSPWMPRAMSTAAAAATSASWCSTTT